MKKIVGILFISAVLVSACIPNGIQNEHLNQEDTLTTLKIESQLFDDFIIEKTILFWRREDGSRMALYNANKLTPTISAAQSQTNSGNSLYKSVFTVPQLTVAQEFFGSHGFTVNKVNSDELLEGYIDDYNTSFERGNEKCIIHWNNEVSSSPDNYIGCAVFEEYDEFLYQEFSSLFIDNPTLFWRITKLEGDFATGTVSSGRGGGWWMAKKIDGKWLKIFSGQEDPLCSVLMQYAVPGTFYEGKCWETDGHTHREWLDFSISEVIDRSGWKMYYSDEFGFSLQYPNDWNFKEKEILKKGFFISHGSSSIAILPQGEFDRGLPFFEPHQKTVFLSDKKAIERVWDMVNGQQLILYNFTDQITSWVQCSDDLINCNRIDIFTDLKDVSVVNSILSTLTINK